MDQKERELRQQLSDKVEEARSLMEQGKLEEAEQAKKAAAAIRQSLDMHIELRGLTPPSNQGQAGAGQPAGVAGLVIDPATHTEDDPEVRYDSIFMKAVRMQPVTLEERQIAEQRALSSNVDEDGGLLIPKDISTKVHELKRNLVSLDQYITVEPTNKKSGTRSIEANADITPFVEITEMTTIAEMTNPKLRPVTFNTKDYGGIIPIPNNLLNDSDQAIKEYIGKWIAKKSVATRNSLIITALRTFTKKTLASIDDFKGVLNVDLDPDVANNAIILTNQDGFNYLDKLKDAQGKALLQPDPTQPTRKLLNGRVIVVVSNRLLPSDDGTTAETKLAPVFIGDLKEGIVMFDRQQYSIKSTDVGGNAFARNSTDIRVIEREDVKVLDNQAVVFGQVEIPA